MKVILLVGGHAETRQRLVDILSVAGNQVLVAATGQEALEMAPRLKPDLILVAIVMPELNGVQTAAQMRNVAGYDNVPIYLLGRIPPLGIHDEPLSSLVNGYLSLDIRKDELLAVVEQQRR